MPWWPFAAAMMSAVAPWLSCMFGSARHSSIASARTSWPRRLASISSVNPRTERSERELHTAFGGPPERSHARTVSTSLFDAARTTAIGSRAGGACGVCLTGNGAGAGGVGGGRFSVSGALRSQKLLGG